MDILSLSTSPAPGKAGFNLGHAQDEASASIKRLSSGNSIARARDDVAALSIAESMQKSITGLRESINNALQIQSYLSIADGAMSRIDEVLHRMSAISIQANSGSLTDKERSFLNLEFSSLKEEIDRLAEKTSFNGISVLQRTNNEQIAYIDSKGTQAKATIALRSGTAASGDNIAINGVLVEISTGTNANNIAKDFTQKLNDASLLAAAGHDSYEIAKIQQATYEAQGSNIIVTHRSEGELSNAFSLVRATSGYRIIADTDRGTAGFILEGGSDGGSNMGGTSVSGGSEGDFITAQNLNKIEERFLIRPENGDNFIEDDYIDINGGNDYIRFIFREDPADNPIDNGGGGVPFNVEIEIGETKEESMRNLIEALNGYAEDPAGDETFGFRQLEFLRDEDELIIRGQNNGSLTEVGSFSGGGTIYNAADLVIREDGRGTLLRDGESDNDTDLDFANGRGGVNVDGVSNRDFIGKISGFKLHYEGANHVKASITVGEHEYVADILDTNPSANSVIQFNSTTGGGFFQIEIQEGQGEKILSDEDMAKFRDSLDTSFKTRTFYQEKIIDPFSFTNGLNFKISTDSNEDIIFDKINVISANDAASGNASISFIANGERYELANEIGSKIGENEIFEFRNTTDSNKIFTISTDNISYDLQDTESAKKFEQILIDSLMSRGKNSNVPSTENFSAGIDPKTGNDLTININYIGTESLFEDPDTLNVLTQESASDAYDMIKIAIDYLTDQRAYVGAVQSRVEYAVNQNNTAIINQENARAVLSDTDVVSESTRFALEQVKINASISLLAQTNALKQALVTRLYSNI